MKKIFYCLLPIIFLVTSCRTSYITNSWKYAGATAKKYNKVMVLAMTREDDRAMQEKMEKHMIGDLQGMGYNAISSLEEYYKAYCFHLITNFFVILSLSVSRMTM